MLKDDAFNDDSRQIGSGEDNEAGSDQTADSSVPQYSDLDSLHVSRFPKKKGFDSFESRLVRYADPYDMAGQARDSQVAILSR